MEDRNEFSEINIISKAIDLRLYIIENALHVEEFISWTLGHLLNIDWKNSKSFGYGSTALSFNQKVQIVQDINGLSSDQIIKLTF